jgi:hypothetical protein
MCTIIFLDKILLQFQSRIFMGGLCPLDPYRDFALDLMATWAVPRPIASLEIRP